MSTLVPCTLPAHLSVHSVYVGAGVAFEEGLAAFNVDCIMYTGFRSKGDTLAIMRVHAGCKALTYKKICACRTEEAEGHAVLSSMEHEHLLTP